MPSVVKVMTGRAMPCPVGRGRGYICLLSDQLYLACLSSQELLHPMTDTGGAPLTVTGKAQLNRIFIYLKDIPVDAKDRKRP